MGGGAIGINERAIGNDLALNRNANNLQLHYLSLAKLNYYYLYYST